MVDSSHPSVSRRRRDQYCIFIPAAKESGRIGRAGGESKGGAFCLIALDIVNHFIRDAFDLFVSSSLSLSSADNVARSTTRPTTRDLPAACAEVYCFQSFTWFVGYSLRCRIVLIGR